MALTPNSPTIPHNTPSPGPEADDFMKFASEASFNAMRAKMGVADSLSYSDFKAYVADPTHFETLFYKTYDLYNTGAPSSLNSVYEKTAMDAIQKDDDCRRIVDEFNAMAMTHPDLKGKVFDEARNAPLAAPPTEAAISVVRNTLMDSPAGAVINQLRGGRTLSGGEGKFSAYLNKVADGYLNTASIAAKAVLDRAAYTASAPMRGFAASAGLALHAGRALNGELRQVAENYNDRIKQYRDPSNQMAMLLSGRADVQAWLRNPVGAPPMPTRSPLQHARDIGGAAAVAATNGIDGVKNVATTLRKEAASLRLGLRPFANLRALKNSLVSTALSAAASVKRAWAKAYCATVTVAHSDSLAKARAGLGRAALGLSVVGGTIGLLHGIHLGPSAAHAATLGFSGHGSPVDLTHAAQGTHLDTAHLNTAASSIAQQHLQHAGSAQDMQAELAQRGVHLSADQIAQATQGKDVHLSPSQVGSLERSGITLDQVNGQHVLNAVSLDHAVSHIQQQAHGVLLNQASGLGMPLSDEESINLMHGGSMPVYHGQAAMFRNLGVSPDGHVTMSDISLASERIDALHDGLKAQLGGVDISKHDLTTLMQGGSVRLSWENQQAIHTALDSARTVSPDITLADLQKISTDHVASVAKLNATLPEANRMVAHDAFADMMKRTPIDTGSNTAHLGAAPDTMHPDAVRAGHDADIKAMQAEHLQAEHANAKTLASASAALPGGEVSVAQNMITHHLDVQHAALHPASMTVKENLIGASTGDILSPKVHDALAAQAHLNSAQSMAINGTETTVAAPVHLAQPAPVHLAAIHPESVHLAQPAPVHLAQPAPVHPEPTHVTHAASTNAPHSTAHHPAHAENHETVVHGHRHTLTAADRLNEMQRDSAGNAVDLGESFDGRADVASVNKDAYAAAAHPGEKGGPVLMAENGKLPDLHTASATHAGHVSPAHTPDAHIATATHEADAKHYVEIGGQKVDLNKFSLKIDGHTGQTSVIETASLRHHPVEPGTLLIRNVNFFAPGPEGHLAQQSLFHDMKQHLSAHQAIPEYDSKTLETMQVIARHQHMAILTDVNGIAVTVSPTTGAPDHNSMVFTMTNKGVEITPFDRYATSVENGASGAPLVAETPQHTVHHLAASGMHGSIGTTEPSGERTAAHVTHDGQIAHVEADKPKEPGFWNKLGNAAYDATVKPTVDMGKGVVEGGKAIGNVMGM